MGHQCSGRLGKGIYVWLRSPMRSEAPKRWPQACGLVSGTLNSRCLLPGHRAREVSLLGAYQRLAVEGRFTESHRGRSPCPCSQN